MRRLGTVLLAVAAVGFVLPAAAEEIIYFTNGTSMPIRSHRIEGDMVHVDLGGNGFMAFPMFMVDRVDGTDQVKLKPSSSRPGSNRMVASARTGGGEGNGAAEAAQPRIKSKNPGIVDNREVPRDQYGMIHAGQPGTQGLSNLQQPGVLRGARNVGNRYVMDSGVGTRQAPRTVGIALREQSGPASTPKTPPADQPKKQPEQQQEQKEN